MKSILKIKQALLILSACFCLYAKAQNLVLNPGFENYYSCPSNVGMMDSCQHWYSDGISSPDYFNSCTSSQLVDIPLNHFGYQTPKSGNSYAGFGPYSYSSVNNAQNNYREFIQTKLNDTLISGNYYCVKFYLSLSDSVLFAASKIGGLFTPSKINLFDTNWPNYYMGGFSPQVSNSLGNYYTDIQNWRLFEHSFQANGNEQFLTIGNFLDNYIDTLKVRPFNYSNWNFSYYYIDDVSVEEIKPAAAGPDQSIAIGDSIQIGLNLDSAAVYAWQPHIGITDTTAINPWVHPTQTTAYTVIKTQCSVTTTDTVVVYVNPVGMEQYNLQSHFKLYPNPNTGEFTIEQNEGLASDFHIFDINGKLVGKYSLKRSSNIIKLNNLDNGIYFYTIASGDKILKRDKIVVIH